MDITSALLLIFTLAAGVAIGLLIGARLAASRRDARLQELTAHAESARAETAELRGLRAEAKADVEQYRADVAEARAEAAAARTEQAEASAQLAGMRAERDAATQRAQQLAADRESLVNQFKVLSGESLERQGKAADATAEERLKRTQQALEPLQALLERYQNRLTEVEKERATMAADLRSQVQAVQMTGEHLRRETHSLATALRKPQVRGAWGETQLRRIAEYAGMVSRCDFDTQTTTTTSADRTIRPDMRVNLTNGRHVFVDAKVPLSAFLDALEAADDTTRAEKMKQFGKNVRSHIDDLSSKEYWKADIGTPEFVVLFLPNENFLFEALEQYPDLHEYAASKNIVIGTPNTLIAMLRAVAYGWKQVSLAEDAAEVLELGRELHGRLAKMGAHVEKTGRSLNTAVRSYNEMVGSLEARVMVTARRFTSMDVSDTELKQLKAVEELPRSVSAEEFFADPGDARTSSSPALAADDDDDHGPSPSVDDNISPTTERDGLWSTG